MKEVELKETELHSMMEMPLRESLAFHQVGKLQVRSGHSGLLHPTLLQALLVKENAVMWSSPQVTQRQAYFLLDVKFPNQVHSDLCEFHL